MALRVAFIGFRHPHIFSLHNLIKGCAEAEIVAACEEDEAAAAAASDRGVKVSHRSYAAMLDAVECDVVACGDYFGIRGVRLIDAMERGRHVIADKPLCTRLDELDRIVALAKAKGLCVGCMLDLCGSGMLRTVRRLIRRGAIGDVQSIHFNGQHPLRYTSRPSWYFEDGKHGGTINDIGIHAIDGIPWLTGQPIVEITAARVWNAKLKACPAFQDGALLMLRLANGGGVLGDVSYLIPDRIGYAMPTYWRMGFAGAEGYIETAEGASIVRVFGNDAEAVHQEPLDPGRPGGYFEDYLAELAGHPNAEGLTTARVLHSSRVALQAQHAADTGRFPVPVAGS